jgi:hypothetical protein
MEPPSIRGRVQPYSGLINSLDQRRGYDGTSLVMEPPSVRGKVWPYSRLITSLD